MTYSSTSLVVVLAAAAAVSGACSNDRLQPTGTGGTTAGSSGGGSSGGSSASGTGGGSTDAGTLPLPLQFQRHSGLGYCIQNGQVQRAEIASGAGGGLVVSGAVHSGWNPPNCGSSDCEVIEAFGPTALSTDQQAQLTALMAAVPTGQCTTTNGGCDPCLVAEVTAGTRRLTSSGCEIEMCSGYLNAVRALITFIDDLAPPRPSP